MILQESERPKCDRSATATIVALHFRGSLWTIGLTLCLCNNYSILNHTKSLIGYPKIHWFIILFPIQMPFSEVYRKPHLQTDMKNHQKSQVSSLIWICIQESISVVAPFGKALNSLGGPRERPSGNAFSASANTRIADANPVKSEYLTDWHQRKQWSSKSDWSSCKPWWIVRFAELGNPELWSPSGNPRGLLENLPSGYFHRELVRLNQCSFFEGWGVPLKNRSTQLSQVLFHTWFS